MKQLDRTTFEKKAEPLFRLLAADAANLFRSGWENVSGLLAGWRPPIDQFFTQLPSFQPACDILACLPEIDLLYGKDSAERLTLQFVYGLSHYLQMQQEHTLPPGAVMEGQDFDPISFTWGRFIEELFKDKWVYGAAANLLNFKCPIHVANICDGIQIANLDVPTFCEMFWCGRKEWETRFFRLHPYNMGSHTLIATVEVPKKPDNAVLTISGGGSFQKLQAALSALRLIKPGYVRLGPISSFRLGFNLGDQRSGHTLPHLVIQMTTGYTLQESDFHEVCYWMERLLQLADGLPSNVETGLQWFRSSYERASGSYQEEVVDEVTAIEALIGFGDKSDLTFKAAFRAASILAGSDAERVSLLKTIKKWYGIRSTVVHGGMLKQSDREFANENEPLRDIVRRLLRALLRLVELGQLAVGSSKNREAHYKGRKCAECIDEILVHRNDLEDFRRSAGLS